MPDLSLKPSLIPLHAWLIEAGTSDAATETLFDGFCGRLVAAGVPIAKYYIWRNGRLELIDTRAMRNARQAPSR